MSSAAARNDLSWLNLLCGVAVSELLLYIFLLTFVASRYKVCCNGSQGEKYIAHGKRHHQLSPKADTSRRRKEEDKKSLQMATRRHKKTSASPMKRASGIASLPRVIRVVFSLN